MGKQVVRRWNGTEFVAGSIIRRWTEDGWKPQLGGFTASGGLVTDIPGYRVHTFYTSGLFSVIQGGDLEYLIVAGGGAGSSGTAGGGGGGQVIKNDAFSPLIVSPGDYPFVVGAGGIAPPGTQSAGQNGSDSSIAAFGLLAKGGGRGAHTGGAAAGATDGGNGGGGANYSGQVLPPGQSLGFGFAGAVAPGDGGGGGGGAGGEGQGRNGGIGVISNIDGFSKYYGGGGGGAANSGAGTGGLGGGGAGNDRAATQGTDGLGGGGGGGWYYADGYGAKGGSGIIIVRYAI